MAKEQITWYQLVTDQEINKYQRIEGAKKLLRGTDINAPLCPELLGKKLLGKFPPLKLAAYFGNYDMAEFLLENGADANVSISFGHTALHFAVTKGHLKLVELLLKHGASAYNVESNIRNPLLTAVQNKDLEIVKLLITYHEKLDVNIPTINGSTLLHLALGYEDIKMAELLVENGADVNKQNKLGLTTLHVALQNACIKSTEFLVDNRADINILYKNESSPLDLISEAKDSLFQYCLKSIGEIAETNDKYDAVIKVLLQSKDYPLLVSKEEHKNDVIRVLQKYPSCIPKKMPVYKSGNSEIDSAFNNEIEQAVEFNRAHFKDVAEATDEFTLVTEYTNDNDLCLPVQNPGFDINSASAAAASSVDVMGAPSDSDN